MTLTEERREDALKEAGTLIELLWQRPDESFAYQLLEAAQKVYSCEREMRQEAELAALAKEMSP